jgi:hypothetical protein
MLRQLWKSLAKKPVRRNARRASPLALEALEDRCVPTAEYFWIGASGGLWSKANNWFTNVPGTVPGPGAYVVYNSPNTSVDDLNIPSSGLLALVLGPQAGTLNIQGSLQQGSGTFVVQEGGTVQVSGSLTNGGVYNQFAGTLNVTGSMQNAGQYDLFGGSIVGTGTFLNSSTGAPAALLAIDALSSTTVTIGANLRNDANIDWLSGTIDLESTLTNMSGGFIDIFTPGLLTGTSGYLVNNSGATIGAGTTGTVTIDVPLGANNTNYGTINCVQGGLEFGLNTLYTNEGIVDAGHIFAGSSITFDGPYQQLANTQNPSFNPLTISFAGDILNFKGDVTLDAGTLGIIGALNAGSSPSTNSLIVNPGATAVFRGSASLAGSLRDSGVVQFMGGILALGPMGQFGIDPSGLVLVFPAGTQSVITGPVYNAGGLTVNPGGQLVLQNSMYTQAATGVTNLNGTAVPGGSVLFQVKGLIDQTGGVFNVTNATVDSQGFTVEVGAVLNFGAGPNASSFNGDVTMNGTMNFTDGNAIVNFNNNLTLGAATSGFTGVVSLYLTDVINVLGTTTFGSVELDFLNVPPTPPVVPYHNLTFGTVVGTPAVSLPPLWTWMFLPGGVMEIG